MPFATTTLHLATVLAGKRPLGILSPVVYTHHSVSKLLGEQGGALPASAICHANDCVPSNPLAGRGRSPLPPISSVRGGIYAGVGRHLVRTQLLDQHDFAGRLHLLDQAAVFKSYPLAVRTDNGAEYTSRAFMG